MNNIKLLTGGLVVIVLALAGGTGYLIWERIQTEVGPSDKVTKQEVQEIRTDVTTLKESDAVQAAKIGVLEDEMVEVKGRVTTAEGKLELQDKLIKKLEGDTATNAEDIKTEKAKREEMQKDLEAHRTELDGIRTELDKAEAERKEIREKLKAQGEKIDEQDKRLSELEKKGDARDQEIAALREELAELKRQLGMGEPKPEG